MPPHHPTQQFCKTDIQFHCQQGTSTKMAEGKYLNVFSLRKKVRHMSSRSNLYRMCWLFWHIVQVYFRYDSHSYRFTRCLSSLRRAKWPTIKRGFLGFCHFYDFGCFCPYGVPKRLHLCENWWHFWDTVLVNIDVWNLHTLHHIKIMHKRCISI